MKFNTKTSQANKTTNLAGGEAFVESPKLALISLLLTSFVKDQYYRSSKEGLRDLVNLINSIPDKKFIAKAAIYARTKFGMRSITHAVAGELASQISGNEWAKVFFDKVVHRPDDMTEILSYVYSKPDGKESNAIRKGFAQAFSRFDEYQLAKYKKDDAQVSLIDVANLVHPAHTPAIEKLIKGTLSTPKTWEAELTKAGQKAENEEDKEKLKKEVWEKLVKERQIGYFALLRNLRNILEQAPELTKDACELLVDEKLIKKSLVLPFRYLTALEEISQVSGVDTMNVRAVLMALSAAVDKALSNVPHFEGTTLVVLDGSSSMSGDPVKIGSLFSSILVKSNNADLIIFSDDAKYINVNPMDSTLTIAQLIPQLILQHFNSGTNFDAPFQLANKSYDRIIILSDMQAWIAPHVPTHSFSEYRKRVGANARIYSFDLQGYGTLQFPENNVFAIAGFSEKIFDVMKIMEQDRNALIHEIEKIQL